MTDPDRWLPLLYPAATGFDYIPQDAVVFADQPTRIGEMAREYRKQLGEDLQTLQREGRTPFDADSFCFPPDAIWKELENYPLYAGDAFTLGRGSFHPKTLLSIPAKQLPSYAGNAQAAAEDLKVFQKQDYRVVILAGDERRAGVLQSFLREHGVQAVLRPEAQPLPAFGECCIGIGAISSGMEYPSLRLAVLTDAQLIRGKNKKQNRKLPADRKRIESYADLSVGDYVVHETHGIGRFSGIVKMQVDGFEKDYIKLNYAGSDVLYVPATQLDMVSKYTGGGEERAVRLSKMGGTEWYKYMSFKDGVVKYDVLLEDRYLDKNLSQIYNASDGISMFYSTTAYKNAAVLGAAAAKGGSLTEFERACDNVMVKYLKDARMHSFGPEYVLGFMAAIENDISCARIILNGLLSKLSVKSIKERLRDTYV